MRIKFLQKRKGATIPKPAHSSDYAVDLTAYAVEDLGNDLYRYYLGFALQVDRNWEAEKICAAPTVYYTDSSISFDPLYIDLHTCRLKFGLKLSPRSSAVKHGMMLTNSVGIVDEGFTGELTVTFWHYNKSLPKYKVGDKVCQMSLEASFPMDFSSVLILDETDRGEGAYGSTDR